jgi:hypothetical protein
MFSSDGEALIPGAEKSNNSKVTQDHQHTIQGIPKLFRTNYQELPHMGAIFARIDHTQNELDVLSLLKETHKPEAFCWTNKSILQLNPTRMNQERNLKRYHSISRSILPGSLSSRCVSCRKQITKFAEAQKEAERSRDSRGREGS